MRASKHLEHCTEDCKYNTSEVCSFGLRTRVGCYLDSDVREYAAMLFIRARETNSIEAAKSIAIGHMSYDST